MSDLVLKIVRLNFAFPVGSVTEAKVKRILKVFEPDGFKNAQHILDQFVLLVCPDKKCHFVITQNLIGFNVESTEPDFVFATTMLTKMIDALLLDNKSTMTFQVIGAFHVPAEGAMKTSLSRLCPIKPEILAKDAPNIIGVGLRFFEKHERDLWEFKVEPLVTDNNFYHIEGIMNFMKPQGVELNIEDARNAYKYFHETIVSFIKENLLDG